MKTISGKRQKRKESGQVTKTLEIARVRGYDVHDLFQYHLVSSSYLFDEDGLMTKLAKSDLSHQLELLLDADQMTNPSSWTSLPSAFVVDVMANIRKTYQVCSVKMTTFGDLCFRFFKFVLNSCPSHSRLDFVFDSYIQNSVKDSERQRRARIKSIEYSTLTESTPLPKDIETFWSNINNKAALQSLLKAWILENAPKLCPQTFIVLSGTIGISEKHCKSIHNELVIDKPQLDSKLEEADIRLVPHCLDCVKDGAKWVVILAIDTDIEVICLHYCRLLKRHGLQELWMKMGVANTTRFVPLNKLELKLGPQLCDVLPALHALTGNDITSKVGTKSASLKAEPTKYLLEFEKTSNAEVTSAEQYLVQVMKKGSTFETMDKLRYEIYHHSKSASFADLPPTSFSLKGHIMRAHYSVYQQLHCLDDDSLDPHHYGFEEDDGLLIPITYHQLLPDNLPLDCNCGKCATNRCPCRKQGVPCISFCKCKQVLGENLPCKNPTREI